MKKKLTIKKGSTIKEAMKLLNKTGENCLLVIDNNKLLGTLTDGDIRRSILSGEKISSPIKNCMNANFKYFQHENYEISKVKNLMIKNKIDLVPLLDKKKFVIDYLTWDEVFGKDKMSINDPLNIPVVIMAGGKGTRMKPFTDVLPKPLLPVNDKTIIEHIIKRFTDVSCSDFYITVNYKTKVMKAFFEEIKPDYNIRFIDEKTPLGTAGSLQLLKNKLRSPFFVTNCDILIDCNYSSLYNFHIKGNYDVTLVASTKEFIIPYGACELNENGELAHINEKPQYDFLINTGLYVLNPEVLKLIPKNKFYHITHLIEDAKNQGMNVGVFPVDDDAWIDVGQWSEYKKALKVI